MLLEGKVAIVTGGAGGIGRGIAERFAEEGCAVGIGDINADAVRKTAEGITATGARAIGVPCDATQEDQVRNLVDTVVKKFGKVDILVNNAGGLPSTAPVDEMSVEEWDSVIALNLRSGFLGCKFVVPHMKAQKYGKIVNISSLGATFPPSSNVHYHSGKGGVLAMTVDLAVGLAPFGIYVNAIIPGPVRTRFFGDRVDDDAYFETLGKTVPIGRVGSPRDIAGVALFFASNLSDFVTGEAITAGGGLPLNPPRAKFQDK